MQCIMLLVTGLWPFHHILGRHAGGNLCPFVDVWPTCSVLFHSNETFTDISHFNSMAVLMEVKYPT